MSHLPPEIWDQITLYLFHPDGKDKGRGWECHLGRSFQRYKELASIVPYMTCIHDVLTLRLVSKVTYLSATRALANRYQLEISPFQKSLGEGAVFLTPSARPNQSQPYGISLLDNIKHLKLGLAGNEVDRFDYAREMIFVRSRANPGGDPSRFLRCDGILNRLSDLIARQKAIESLEIRLSSVFESDYNGSAEDSHAPQVDLEYHETILNALTTSLQQPLKHLVDLRLILPCTRDFDRLNAALSDDTLAQLRHLYLGVTDATGLGGSVDYIFYDEDEDSCAGDDNGRTGLGEDDDDDDVWIPRSNLQQKYPNKKCMHSLLRLISRSPNLKSLGISCTHMLHIHDSDAFTWTPTAGGLETIVLSRVRTSAETLVRLLSPATGHSSGLRHLWLHKVHLTTGYWHTVFKHLYDHASVSLQSLHLEQLCYSLSGDSSHLRRHNNRPWEDWSVLWSEDPVDEEVLEKLVGKVDVDLEMWT